MLVGLTTTGGSVLPSYVQASTWLNTSVPAIAQTYLNYAQNWPAGMDVNNTGYYINQISAQSKAIVAIPMLLGAQPTPTINTGSWSSTQGATVTSLPINALAAILSVTGGPTLASGAVAIPAGSPISITSGSLQQTFITSAPVLVGDTSISINSTTWNASYPNTAIIVAAGTTISPGTPAMAASGTTSPSTAFPMTLGVDSTYGIASGVWDAAYTEVFQAIAAHRPDAMLRIGWENYLNVYPWAGPAAGSNYVLAYQHLVTLARSVSSAFTFLWDGGGVGYGSGPVGAYNPMLSNYPGNSYVDYITADVYDTQSPYGATGWNSGTITIASFTSSGSQTIVTCTAAHGLPNTALGAFGNVLAIRGAINTTGGGGAECPINVAVPYSCPSSTAGAPTGYTSPSTQFILNINTSTTGAGTGGQFPYPGKASTCVQAGLNFARQQNKPFGVPEFGINNNVAGDDPAWLQACADWMIANSADIAFALYFDFPGGAFHSDFATNPNSGAMFKSIFGYPTTGTGPTTANTGTYDNILLANSTSPIVIQDIVGAPTGYNVYYDGALITSGSITPGSSPAFVGGTDNSVSGTGTSTLSLTPKTGTATPAVGNTLTLTVGTDSPGQPNAIAVAGGNAVWTTAISTLGQNRPGIYIGKVVVAGSSAITITANTGQQVAATVSCWTNVTTAGPLDKSGTADTASGATQATGPTFTPSVGREVIIAVVSGSATIAAPYGTPTFTEFNTVSTYKTGNGSANYSSGYVVQSSATALGAWGWNVSGGTAYTWVSAISLSPAVGGTTCSIALPTGWTSWKPGYYYIDFVTATSGANGLSVDSVQVNMFRDLGNLPSPYALPPVNADPTIGILDSTQVDLYLHGQLGLGPERYSINQAATPTAAGTLGGSGQTIAGIEGALVAEERLGLYLSPDQADPARPRSPFVNFPNDITTAGGGSLATSSYDTGVSTVISALGPGTASNVTWFEGKNEPDVAGLTDAQYAAQYNELRNAIRTQLVSESLPATAALVMGPGYTSSAPNGANGALAPYLTGTARNVVATFISDLQGLGGNLDALSLHDYNGFTGNPRVTDGWLGGARTMLTTFGLSAIPIFITELGTLIKDFWQGTTFASITERRMATWTAQSYLTMERWGIPKEQVAYYYDTNHGENASSGGVYSWIKSNDLSLGPQATFFRVFSEEVWGKTWLRSLSFGSNGDNYYRAEVFSEGSSGSGTGACVAIYAPGQRFDTVTLSNVGGGTITVSDWQGNLSTITPVAGTVTIAVKDTPVYVRLPLGVASSVAVLSVGSGINSTPIPGSSAHAGNVATSLSAQPIINDGQFQTGGYLNGPDNMYQATTFPHYVELDWSGPVVINQVAITQANPYLDFPSTPQCAMLTGKLEYWNGSAWVGCPTVQDTHWSSAGVYNNPTASQITTTIGHDEGPGLMVFSGWDQEWEVNVGFTSTITTTKIRLTVNSTSVGNFVANSAYTAAVTISEFQVFNVSGASPPIQYKGSATVDLASSITLVLSGLDLFGHPESTETFTSSITLDPASAAIVSFVKITDTTYTFTPLALGTATVKVTAVGSLGHTVTQTGTITVTSETVMSSAQAVWSIHHS